MLNYLKRKKIHVSYYDKAVVDISNRVIDNGLLDYLKPLFTLIERLTLIFDDFDDSVYLK